MIVANTTTDSSDSRRDSSRPLWAELVSRIKLNDTTGLEELYRVFSRGIRFSFCRRLGPQDLDDRIHNTFLTVVRAIQQGDLREPDRLMGYVRTIVRRQIAAQIESNVYSRSYTAKLDSTLVVQNAGSDPEETAICNQNAEIARKMLKSIAPRGREILIRFYLEEQPADQICAEMGLTETQFRQLKSRAKIRFGELGKRRIREDA